MCLTLSWMPGAFCQAGSVSGSSPTFPYGTSQEGMHRKNIHTGLEATGAACASMQGAQHTPGYKLHPKAQEGLL